MKKYQSSLNLSLATPQHYSPAPNTKPLSARSFSGEKSKHGIGDKVKQVGFVAEKENIIRQANRKGITHLNQKPRNGREIKNDQPIQTFDQSQRPKREDYKIIRSKLDELGGKLSDIKKAYQSRVDRNLQTRKIARVRDTEKQIVNGVWQKQTMTKNYYQERSPKRNKPSSPRDFSFFSNCRYPAIEEQPQRIEDELTIINSYVAKTDQKVYQLKHLASQRYLRKSSALKRENSFSSLFGEQNQYYLSVARRAVRTSNPSSLEQLCLDHINTSRVYMTNFQKAILPEDLSLRTKKLSPPPPNKKHTIVFDLDETLIHCHGVNYAAADLILPLVFPNGRQLTVGISIRPFARQCLRELSKNFELMVYTASHPTYAKAIIQTLDPTGRFISEWYAREDCYKTPEGFYLKDLRVIDRKLKNLLLVDNSVCSFWFQLQNGIPIIPFYENKADLELKSLIEYLKEFLPEYDVRIKNSATMKLAEYHKYGSAKNLISALYA